MLLEDATSKEEVARALEDDDQELREDINEKLDVSMRWWDAYGIHKYVDQDEEEVNFLDIATHENFIDEVISQSPGEYDLGHVPREEVASSLRYDATHARRGRGAAHWGPFYVDESSAGGFSYRLSTQLSAVFPEQHLPENAEFIPPEMAHQFWDSLDGHFEWDDRDTVGENHGVGEGESVWIVATHEGFNEWCRDLISLHMYYVVQEDPAAAKELFFQQVTWQNGPLGKKLRNAGLPDEELLSFASQWFESENAREEVLDTIKDYFATIETGHNEPREVIGEWTQADLRAMGITKGPLYEEAPWKLIKLHAADLRLEGALQRNCVGDSGMGYVKALKDGEIEVLSLRSRANKPRFTLEIDPQVYAENIREVMAATDDNVTDEELRAENVKQIKGKANRLPGFADTRAVEVKFPDEVVFWINALQQMFGVNAVDVADMRAVAASYPSPVPGYRRQLRENPGNLCTGFDLPYSKSI